MLVNSHDLKQHLMYMSELMEAEILYACIHNLHLPYTYYPSNYRIAMDIQSGV